MGIVPDDLPPVASSGDASPTLPSNIATPRRKAPWRCVIRPYPVKPLFQRRWARRHPAHSVEDGQRSPKVADSAPAGELVQASTRTYGAQADGGLPAKAKSNVSDRRTRAPLVIGDVEIDSAAKWEWLAQ